MTYQDFVYSRTSTLCETARLDSGHLRQALAVFEAASVPLDAYKKSIFYGKPPEQLGLPVGSGHFVAEPTLFHALLGVMTEAGELAPALLTDLSNRQNIIEELGDVMFYVAMAANALNVSIGELLEANERKLRQRYPDKFTSAQALSRDTNAELRALNGEVA